MRERGARRPIVARLADGVLKVRDTVPDLAREAMGLGTASNLHVEPIATLDHSTVARVSAAGAGPQSVIVKCSDRMSSLALLQREVRFYARIAPCLGVGICPTCYLYREGQDECALVLEDLPGKVPAGGELPDRAMAAHLVMALARLHRSARDIDRLADFWSESLSDDPYNSIAGRLAAFPGRLETFLACHAGSLDAESTSMLERLTRLGDLMGSLGEETIVHGDAHFGNAVHANDSARLIDWGNVALGIGEIDVAHAIAMNLPRSLGRKLESDLLARYANYCEKDLTAAWRRYKAGVLYAITASIAMWQFGVGDATWRYLFTNAMDAARDLDAIEMLGESSHGR